MEFNLGPAYYQALKINETLQGAKGIEPGRIDKRPELEEDAFERVVQAYQDRYDSDRLARQGTPPPVVIEPTRPGSEPKKPAESESLAKARKRLEAAQAEYDNLERQFDEIGNRLEAIRERADAAGKRGDYRGAAAIRKEHDAIYPQFTALADRLKAASRVIVAAQAEYYPLLRSHLLQSQGNP